MKEERTTSLAGERILVTGASGFIGPHLLKRLLQTGAKVHALSLARDWQNWAPEKIGLRSLSALKRHSASLSERGALARIVRRVRPDRVVHMAALVNLDRSHAVARECLRSNAEGTLNLLEALSGCRVRRFVFLSTEEVYGSGSLPYKEGQRELPPSPYAVSKLAGERLCFLYGRLAAMPVTILRLSTCYGPGQGEGRLIPSIIRDSLAGRAIRVGRLDMARDFIYVEDAVEGMIAALTRPRAAGETINLGSRRAVTVGRIIQTVRRLTHSRSKIALRAAARRKGEADLWAADGAQAKRCLGWSPQTSLESGLRQTIQWHEKELKN